MQENKAHWALFCFLMVKMAADDTVSASCLFEGNIPGGSSTLTTDEIHGATRPED